jgi:hypothetical protein
MAPPRVARPLAQRATQADMEKPLWSGMTHRTRALPVVYSE